MTNPRHRRAGMAAGFAAIGLGLSACSGATAVSQAYYDYSFSTSELGYASTFGPIPVVVLGALPADARAIVDGMNARRSDPLRFIPATGPVGGGYAMVLAFGPPAAGVNFCGAAPGAPPPAGAVTHITGTFCLGPRLRSQAVASLSGSQVDPTVGGLVTALFSPDDDPTRRRAATSVAAFRRH